MSAVGSAQGYMARLFLCDIIESPLSNGLPEELEKNILASGYSDTFLAFPGQYTGVSDNSDVI